MEWIALAAGSALGGCARYACSLAAARWLPHSLPWGTLLVNLTGCLLIGLLSGHKGPQALPRLLLVVGFCGSFTTFSTFALETLQLLETGNFLRAAGVVFGSVLVGLACVRAGISLSRFL
jgi:CrcB protein